MRRCEFVSTVGGTAVAAAIGHPASATAADSSCFCVAADPHCNDGPGKGMEALGTGADRLMHVFEHIGALPDDGAAPGGRRHRPCILSSQQP